MISQSGVRLKREMRIVFFCVFCVFFFFFFHFYITFEYSNVSLGSSVS